MEFHSCHPGWSAMAWSQFTATSASRVQVGSPASASEVAGITATCHHAQLILVFLVETGFGLVSQAGLQLPISGDPPASFLQNAGITCMSHCMQRLLHTLSSFSRQPSQTDLPQFLKYSDLFSSLPQVLASLEMALHFPSHLQVSA